MILVVGLAVAGIVIAAAFYFSIRAGNGRDKRGRSAAPGRAGAAGRRAGHSGTAPGSRTGNARRAAPGGRPVNPGRAANGSSRTYREPDGRRGQQGPPRPAKASAKSTPADAWPAQGRSAARSATRPSREAHADAEAAARTRRRVSFRKGADVDEELWPTETFDGISDEQFWDDLASDKPLTTTARTAQQDPGTSSRPPGAVRVAASPTAIQPTYAATRPARNMTSRRPDASRAATAVSVSRPAHSGGQSASTAPQPLAGASQLLPAAPPPSAPVAQPSEAGGRRRRINRADEEDPLTSAAFALRSSGPVDGRSALISRRPTDTAGERYGAPAQGGSRSGGYADTAPYPYPGTSYGDTSAATRSPDTPPHGENFGYRRPDPAGDPPRHTGGRSHARHASNGHGDRDTGPRPAYQHENGYRTGGYLGSGYPAGGNRPNGYPQHHRHAGHPEDGYRAPYDPRHNYRRLPPQR